MKNGEGAAVTDPLVSARAMLAEAREELTRADGKASIVLATVGIAASAILGGLLAGDWRPSELVLCARAVWWAGVMLALVGIVLVASAVYPRLGRVDSSSRPTYFGHIAAYSTAEQVRLALEGASAPDDDRVFDQLWHVSRIVQRKYQLLVWAFRLLGCALMLILIAHLLHGWIAGS